MPRVVLIASIIHVVVLSLVGGLKAAPPTSEERSAFKWFDGLGLVDLKGKHWVRVATGNWSRSGDKPPENSFVGGFLLAADAEQFTVFTTSAETIVYVKTPKGTAEHERVGYEERDLEADATTQLESLRHPPDDEQQRMRAHFGQRLSQRGQIFILARGCATNGLEDLAHDLCAQAEQNPDHRVDGNERAFLTELSEDFANATIWKSFLKFEDAKIPRAELLKTFTDFVTYFPQSQYTARAREMAAILEKMVKEDETHAHAATRPAEKLPVADRVAELIFQLRDQNGHQYSQPGACDIFEDERGDNSPAAQLVAIGYDAVPQLIDALNDDRFTRSVGYQRDVYFSHYVLRVGDCAEAILSRIAGRRFYQRRSTSGAMLKDGQADDSKRQVQRWWAEMQKKGEKQVLIDAVTAGDDEAMEQAGRLLKKYPDAALDAIVKGVMATKSDWLRVQFVSLAGELPGDSPLPFLKQQMAKGATIDARVAAARGMHGRGDANATVAMIREWNRQCDGVEGRDRQTPESLTGFLASCDDPAAIDAMKAKIGIWPVASRLSIVEMLGDSENFMVMSAGPGAGRPGAAPARPKRATLDAIEALLIAQLQDTEERTGMSGSIGDDSFADPRICDMAAHSLASRWNKLYSFKMSAPLPGRNRRLVVIQNSWRNRHGLPPLPMPQTRKIDPVAPARIDPLLQRLSASDPGARANAAAQIEALGLGALPAIRRAIDTVPDGAGDERRAELETLAKRLSRHVDAIEIPQGLAVTSPELKAALDALKGKPLTSQVFVGVLTSFAKIKPPGIRGIKLDATRDDDCTGVVIRVRLDPGTFASNSQSDYAQRVTSGSEVLFGSSGGADPDYLATADAWQNLSRFTDKALAATPETPFEVHVTISREK